MRAVKYDKSIGTPVLFSNAPYFPLYLGNNRNKSVVPNFHTHLFGIFISTGFFFPILDLHKLFKGNLILEGFFFEI